MSRPFHSLNLLQRDDDPIHHAVEAAELVLGALEAENTVNGFTFTTEQFAGWLADAGFVEHRLVEPIAFQQCMIATKATRRS